MDTGSPIFKGRESYENFRKLNWCKVKEQVPLTYGKVYECPLDPKFSAHMMCFFIHHNQNA